MDGIDIILLEFY